MTAKEIRQTLINQCNGDKDMAMNLYHQIQRSLKEEKKPLNIVWWVKITRNDYIEPLYEGQEESRKVIHFELNNCIIETCL